MTALPRVLVFGAILLLPACGSAEDASTDTTESTETDAAEPTESTGAVVPGCECTDPEAWAEESYTCATPACGGVLKQICDWDSEEPCEPQFQIQESEVDCMLDRLVSGDEVLLAWSYSEDGNVSGDGGLVKILPNRQALVRRWNWFDLAGKNDGAGVVALKSADYFEACKAETDLRARFECAIAWADGEPSTQCDLGGSFQFS